MKAVSKKLTRREMVAKRGHAIYSCLMKRELARVRRGRSVAIDVKSGEFEVGDDAIETTDRLLARQPKAQVWMERIGFPAYNCFGGWGIKR